MVPAPIPVAVEVLMLLESSNCHSNRTIKYSKERRSSHAQSEMFMNWIFKLNAM